ncbi:hypothetical protein JN06_01107 [Bacteroides zoogleoformans]|uniref:hypothetical protein n=1 Tax=Bacteroides zoogleoformans TaxID=28119 RepID=UPI00101AE3E5|nr:hypothetical protein [Bacteroides zoogleoformans]TWJ16815.1 hypothetical protein JN06_01107 [Bacteroides zoogleoformans]
MEKERKGCLLLIGFTAMASVGIYIALRLEWPFLKNLMYLTPALVVPYIGEKYFKFNNKNKKTPKWRWALLIVLIFLLAGLVTWLMKSR